MLFTKVTLLHLHSSLPLILTGFKLHTYPPDKLMQFKNYAAIPSFPFAEKINVDFKEKKLKALIFGNFGAMNYGDEAILAGQLHELQKVKNLSTSVISRFPDTVRKLHTNGISMLNIPGIIKAMYTSDFLIVGGGGLFCKNDAGFMGIFFQLYMILLFFMLPMVLQKKLYVLGIGFYKNTNPVISAIVRPLLKKVEMVTVRDTYSYMYLSSKGISVELYKDHSLFMELLPITNILRDTFIKTRFTKKRFNVGIAIKKPETAYETAKLLNALTTFIAANADDTDFWIFPLDNHAGYNDRKFAEDICFFSKIHQNVRIHILPTHWHPSKLFSSFQLMDYFIAMRFHGLVYAYRYNIPMYGMTYDEKCTSFLESIGKKTIEIRQVSAEEMQQAFNKVKKKKTV